MKKGKLGVLFVTLAMMLGSCSSSGGPSGEPGSQAKSQSDLSSWSSGSNAPGIVTSIQGGTVDSKRMTIYLFVEKEVSSVSLAKIIEVSDGTIWRLYRDEQEIPTKIATGRDGSLMDGDNAFYIVASANGGLIENTYTLTIHRSYMVKVDYYHNGKLLLQDEALTGIEYTLKETFDVAGYVYNGLTDENGQNVSGTVTPWADMLYYVDATPKNYGVFLDPNQGKVESTSLSFEFDSNYTLPIPTRNGYRFVGWYEGDALFPEHGVWQEDRAVNLLAHWEVVDYTITYNLMGGTNNLVNPASYTIEDEDIILGDPLKLGYDFTGWVDDNGNAVAAITKGSVGNVILNAQYSVHEYAIVYNVDEDTENPNPTSYTVEDGDILLKGLEKEGLEFYGWLNEENETVTEIKGDTYSDLTLTPCWGSPGLSVANGVLLKAPDIDNVLIPSSVNSIGSCAFQGCSSLKEITIPDSVTSIGAYAFKGCSSLAEITIPDSVTSIGDFAFESCSSLVKITIPDSVVSIKQGTFSGCTSLTKVTIPDSVTSIGDSAFDGCSSIVTITIPDSVTSIGYFAFRNCYRLAEVVNRSSLAIEPGSSNYGHVGLHAYQVITDSSVSKLSINQEKFLIYQDGTFVVLVGYYGEEAEITIPDYVTSIGGCAFAGCSSLASITIPDSVTSIGDKAFAGCPSLTEAFISCSSTSIGRDAFLNCRDLCLTITKGTTGKIPNRIYSGQKGITYVVISEGVASIGDYAFSGCSSLKEITIPDSIASIGQDAFLDCRGLCLTITKGTTGKIPNKICSGLKGITYVVISEGVTSIGNNAFEDCSSLKEITIPDSVTSIGNYAFSGCSSLKGITIPDSVTSIGNYAFSGCSSLKEITIPSSVTSIGQGAFNGCRSLTELTIPSSVSSIGSSAFEDCRSLTELTIPSSVTSIGSRAFRGCSSLKEVTIPDSVTSIGEQAFSDCTSLTKVTIPNSITFIPRWAFGDCWYLRNITIPDSVTSIGEYAFCDCSSLAGITIPDSVTSIGAYAFEDCSSFAEITIPDSVTSLGSYVFHGCNNLGYIYCEADSQPRNWADHWKGDSYARIVWGYNK